MITNKKKKSFPLIVAQISMLGDPKDPQPDNIPCESPRGSEHGIIMGLPN